MYFKGSMCPIFAKRLVYVIICACDKGNATKRFSEWLRGCGCNKTAEWLRDRNISISETENCIWIADILWNKLCNIAVVDGSSQLLGKLERLTVIRLITRMTAQTLLERALMREKEGEGNMREVRDTECQPEKNKQVKWERQKTD